MSVGVTRVNTADYSFHCLRFYLTTTCADRPSPRLCFYFVLVWGFFFFFGPAEPVFVQIQQIPDSAEKNDDKLYFFFREKSLDSSGGASPTVLARVGRVCLVRPAVGITACM